MTLRIERYKNTRHWALYDGHELVVVTVYRRGAREAPPRKQPRKPRRGRPRSWRRTPGRWPGRRRPPPRRRGPAPSRAARRERLAAAAASSAWPRHRARHRARLASAATSGSATDVRRPPAQPPGVFPARQLPPDGAQQVLSRLARGFAPPEGLGLDRFCSATTLASAWPERCPVPYAAGVGRVPPWGCLRGLLPLHTPQQWAGSLAEPEWQPSVEAGRPRHTAPATLR